MQMSKSQFIFKKIGAFLVDWVIFNITFFSTSKLAENVLQQKLFIRVPVNPVNPLSIHYTKEFESLFTDVQFTKVILFLVLGILYWVVIPLGSRNKSTIGMKVLGLEFRSFKKDAKLSVPQLFLRYVSSFASYLLLGIGYIIGLFNNHSMTFHDMLTKTMVQPKERV